MEGGMGPRDIFIKMWKTQAHLNVDRKQPAKGWVGDTGRRRSAGLRRGVRLRCERVTSPLSQGRRTGRLWVDVGEAAHALLMEGSCGNLMNSTSSMR